MVNEWTECHLSDLCESVDYGYTTSAKEQVCGPKLLRITDIVHGFIDWNSVPYCEIPIPDISKYRLNHGDLVIARTGATTGRSTYISEPPEAVFASYLIRLKVGKLANSRYIGYFLKSDLFWSYMHGVLGDKSAQPNASATTMTKVKVLLPPLPEQQAIACILGALDDKIELNRKINQTLEEMARAIFKSWFVDFEPVKAKVAGQKLPGLAPYISDLFPDSFEESDLGKIPKGWRDESLTRFAQVIGGGTPKTKVPDYWGGNIPWFSVVDAPAPSDIFVVETEKRITQAGLDNSSTRVLSVGTTIITARGTVGKLAMVGVPMAMNQSCYGLRTQNGDFPAFLYFILKRMVGLLQQHSHGSVFDTITRATLDQMRFVQPSESVLLAYERGVGPLLDQVRNNILQERSLAELRDTLLPKLISGKLRVPDAERIVGRCV